MDLTPEQERQIRRAALEGRPAPDGPRLEGFHPLTMAQALEHECERARLVGWPKISVHMDVADAVALALVLRQVR